MRIAAIVTLHTQACPVSVASALKHHVLTVHAIKVIVHAPVTPAGLVSSAQRRCVQSASMDLAVPVQRNACVMKVGKASLAARKPAPVLARTVAFAQMEFVFAPLFGREMCVTSMHALMLAISKVCATQTQVCAPVRRALLVHRAI